MNTCRMTGLAIGVVLWGSLPGGWFPGAWVGPAVRAAEALSQQPRLQFFNRSPEPADVLWIDADGRRTVVGRVAPGANTIVDTTLGHRFAVVGHSSGSEESVTATVPVQAFVFRPPAADQLPAAEENGGEGTVIPPPARLKVDPFHTKYTSAGGFPIVASARVNDHALLEAAYLVNQLLAARPDVRQALVDSGTRLCVIGHDEFTTDLPEFAFLADAPLADFPGLSPRDFWDARARGTGGSDTDPYSSCGEENLLGFEGDPYAAECILIHEFAHAIHLRGMANVDPTFDGRVRAAYESAMQAGLWRGKYASVNHHEYFAEGVQSWFDDNRFNDHDHNHVHLRHQLLEYDPGLAALCREVFGDTELSYTKPAARLTAHLADYDPATAPRFQWPERLEEAKRAIRRHAEERSRPAAADSPSTADPSPDDAQGPRP